MVAGGTAPGGFFTYDPASKIANRWDPLKPTVGGKGDWVQWVLPPEPKESEEGFGDAVRGALSRFGKDDDEKDAAKDGSGASPTASGSIGEMYSKAIEKFRDNVKWVVVAAGAVAAALVGTAPLSGAGAAFAGGWSDAAIGLVVAVVGVSGVFLGASWAMQPIEARLSDLAGTPSFAEGWKTKLQSEYSQEWSNLLDGRATSLADYAAYRSAWLSTVSDIDGLILNSKSEGEFKALASYKKHAQTRIAEDSSNVGLVLKRGIAAQTRSRANRAVLLMGALWIAAAIGYVNYLGGVGAPPIITSLESSVEKPGEGDTVILTVQATGTGFEYRWWRVDESDPEKADPIAGEDGPTLTIKDYSEDDAGTYRVRVYSAEAKAADLEEIELKVPEKEHSKGPT